MNFPDSLFPTELLWACNALALLILGYCIKTAPWSHLKKPDLLHVWLGFIVALMLIWSVKAGIKPGLNFHLLGATMLSLMFGLPLALLALTVVLLGITLFGMSGWLALGVNFLIMAFVPVLFSTTIFKWADEKLPNHFFVYVLISAFFCAGLSISLCGIASTYILTEAEAYSSQYLTTQYLPFYILMGWSEAMLTGMAITLMAVYRPEWLITFEDSRYLKKR